MHVYSTAHDAMPAARSRYINPSSLQVSLADIDAAVRRKFNGRVVLDREKLLELQKPVTESKKLFDEAME